MWSSADSPALHSDVVYPDSRPLYILEIQAEALGRVQDLIAPGDGEWVDPPIPTQELWDAIVDAAFPPPPMA